MWGVSHTHPLDLYRECLADKIPAEIDAQKHKVLVEHAAEALEGVYAASQEAAHVGTGFDGGEFSGPAHARMAETEARRTVTLFAGVTFDEAYDELLRHAKTN